MPPIVHMIIFVIWGNWWWFNGTECEAENCNWWKNTKTRGRKGCCRELDMVFWKYTGSGLIKLCLNSKYWAKVIWIFIGGAIGERDGTGVSSDNNFRDEAGNGGNLCRQRYWRLSWYWQWDKTIWLNRVHLHSLAYNSPQYTVSSVRSGWPQESCRSS